MSITTFLLVISLIYFLKIMNNLVHIWLYSFLQTTLHGHVSVFVIVATPHTFYSPRVVNLLGDLQTFFSSVIIVMIAVHFLAALAEKGLRPKSDRRAGGHVQPRIQSLQSIGDWVRNRKRGRLVRKIGSEKGFRAVISFLFGWNWEQAFEMSFLAVLVSELWSKRISKFPSSYHRSLLDHLVDAFPKNDPLKGGLHLPQSWI